MSSNEEEFYERPYKDESWKELTLGDLRKLNLPDDYKIKFDSFCGRCDKSDVLIDHENKEISVNGY